MKFNIKYEQNLDFNQATRQLDIHLPLGNQRNHHHVVCPQMGALSKGEGHVAKWSLTCADLRIEPATGDLTSMLIGFFHPNGWPLANKDWDSSIKNRDLTNNHIVAITKIRIDSQGTNETNMFIFFMFICPLIPDFTIYILSTINQQACLSPVQYSPCSFVKPHFCSLNPQAFPVWVDWTPILVDSPISLTMFFFDIPYT